MRISEDGEEERRKIVPRRRRARKTTNQRQSHSYSTVLMMISSILVCSSSISTAFVLNQPFSSAICTSTLSGNSHTAVSPPSTTTKFQNFKTKPHTTELNVWWFGGTETTEPSAEEECELVAVRIDRTSANSRRIAGEISMDTSLENAWGILTDYNNLSIHVPNLLESQVQQTQSRNTQPGDGQHRCRLYQKGAQKIVGFDFSASVTMDMTERVVSDRQRQIQFKCVDSQFFSEFDGTWTVLSEGLETTVCRYEVNVRPKGPVPVAALEWRIREDVPTNLRAVKAAALKLGDSVQVNSSVKVRPQSQAQAATYSVVGINQRRPSLATVNGADAALLDWDKDETMAKYL